MRKRIAPICLAFLFLSCACAASAPTASPPDPASDMGEPTATSPGPGMKPHDRLMDELGLSKDQQEKFAAARKENLDIVQKLRQERGATVLAMKQLVENQASDREIAGKIRALRDNRKQLDAAQDNFVSKLQSFLTPTQQAKMVLWMARRMRSRMPMHPNPSRPGPGPAAQPGGPASPGEGMAPGAGPAPEAGAVDPAPPGPMEEIW